MKEAFSKASRAQEDEIIIRQVLEGDIEAFALLIKSYQARILRLGYGFYKRQEDAEDFAQDVFLKAYSALPSFKGKSSFSTWLVRIAYNTGINGKKRTGRYELLDSEPIDSRNLGPEELSIRNETINSLKKAMGGLPEKYALCLDLYFAMGMKYEDISEVTGFPVNTIKSHVFRAKRDLREALKKEGL